jgi:hypothetical protein
MLSQDGEMVADPPVPRAVKAADTPALGCVTEVQDILYTRYVGVEDFRRMV